MTGAAADPVAYWTAAAATSAPAFPRLSGDLTVDVAVVGGGIVGITTARLLKDAGLTVAVIEARRVGREVTGKSTAKITTQHSLIYDRLIRRHGEHAARIYAEANTAAMARIAALVAEHGLRCDHEPADALCYTRAADQVESIEREVAAAQRLGLPASLTRDAGLPYPVAAAVRFTGQAQFHPHAYVAGLAATLPGDGSHVLEDTRATDVHADHVVTPHGTVRARHVVMATHLPLGLTGGLFAEAFPTMHPVVAAPVDAPVADGAMVITIDQPTHSLRTHRGPDGLHLVAVGGSYEPGDTAAQGEAFAALEDYLRRSFGIDRIAWRWTNEDYTPADDLPYVGRSSAAADAVLVATGFRAWGITNGTAAAMLLTDLITGRDSPWAAVFDARRIKPLAAGPKVVTENLKTGVELVSGYLSRRGSNLDALAAGDGRVLSLDGHRVAAHRDAGGQLHLVSAVCPHMGCIVGWNPVDRTWDCPCHGSRFTVDGDILHGPARQPLAPLPPDGEA